MQDSKNFFSVKILFVVVILAFSVLFVAGGVSFLSLLSEREVQLSVVKDEREIVSEKQDVLDDRVVQSVKDSHYLRKNLQDADKSITSNDGFVK